MRDRGHLPGLPKPAAVVVCAGLTLAAWGAAATAAAPVALDLEKAGQTRLTLYSDQGLVSQTLPAALTAGVSLVQLRPDPSDWDIDSLTLTARDGEQTAYPFQQGWLQPLTDPDSILQQLEGKSLELYRPGRETPLRGRLQSWYQDSGLLLLPDGRLELFQWQPGMSVRTIDAKALPGARIQPLLNASFRLSKPVEQVRLSYLNQGLNYSNRYQMVTHPESGTMDLGLVSLIRNDSSTGYRQASLQLASGDSGDKPEQLRAGFGAMTADMGSAEEGAVRERSGELLFFDMPGRFDLAAHSVLSVPLFREQGAAYSSRYRYRFYGQYRPAGHKAVTEHPLQELLFTPGQDIPAGPLDIREQDQAGRNRLVYQGAMPHVAGGQKVQLSLGQSYTLAIERSSVDVRQKSDSWEVDWQLNISNRQSRAARIVIEDSGYNLVDMESLKGLEQQDGLVLVTIPAGESRTVSFTSVYRKN